MGKKSVAECEDVVLVRALRLVRLHKRGRKPEPNPAKRAKLHADWNRALDLLIAAADGYDAAWERHRARMDDYYKRRNAALIGHQRRKGGS